MIHDDKVLETKLTGNKTLLKWNSGPRSLLQLRRNPVDEIDVLFLRNSFANFCESELSGKEMEIL